MFGCPRQIVFHIAKNRTNMLDSSPQTLSLYPDDIFLVNLHCYDVRLYKYDVENIGQILIINRYQWVFIQKNEINISYVPDFWQGLLSCNIAFEAHLTSDICHNFASITYSESSIHATYPSYIRLHSHRKLHTEQKRERERDPHHIM